MLRTVFICLAILLTFNAALSSHRWIPAVSPLVVIIPTAESLALLWLVILSVHLGRIKRVITLGLVAALFAIMAIFSAAEAFFQFIYARPFSPAADVPMVRGGLLLLFGEIGALADTLAPLAIALIVVLFAAVGVAIGGSGSLLLRRWDTRLSPRAIALSATVPLLVGLAAPQLLSADLVRSLAGDSGFDFVDAVEYSEPANERVDAEPEAAEYAFAGLLDRDIYVFVIEAYGYAAFSRDELYRQLAPDFARFGDVLERHGYGIKSNYLLSPVAGGFSWLAEATFLSGQWINAQPRFEQLYENQVTTLSGMLHDGGYYTVTLRPGTVHGSWPEAWELYRFEDALVAYEGDFDYHGPGFSYVPITDQFAIWKAHKHIQQVRAPGGAAHQRPLLAYYQLVSSHTPFNRIPPYIEEWDALGDGTIYHERSDEILRFDNTWGGGSQLDEGFVASISYVFTVLSEYIDRFMDHDRSPIIIVFGDHQPQRPIREQDAHLSVPIHIASRDAEILQRFARNGYTPGIRAEQPAPHPRMSEFFPMFAELVRDTSQR